MTLLHFTFGAIPYHDASKGTHIIHAWISQSEPTRTDAPGDERRAAKDAQHILNDILLRNVGKLGENDEQLLQDGTIPPSVTPVFTFAIGTAWDRSAMMPTYKQFDYATLDPDPRFAPVAALGRELYDYTFSVLKERERCDRANANAPKFKWDNITIQHGRDAFSWFCKERKMAHFNWGLNKVRFDCPNLRNGYCSPMKPNCPCYKNGRCEEVK